ncbi:filament-like plant protein 7 [Cornus florida]|uniref:filament-like plant protein 7 n=1 Tax=Cornus florida TaxID=4283 RepID=UPI00289B0C4C|nr:filament-like plant protein 7 [Cornus florida]XP_059652908.1 filament-like plant protein 7 [Cornus florida]
MDNKSWLWRKRSSEKTIIAKDRPDASLKGNEEGVVEPHPFFVVPTEKELCLENSVKNLNEKLASLTSECKAKDDLVAKYEKMAQEAIAGREKAETEIVSLKQELDEASRERLAANERLTHLNVALKEYMQQLNSVREEQEQRVHDAVMKTSREFEKSQRKLEEKYTETSKRLANLSVENTQLKDALVLREKLIEDLSRRKSQTEAEFDTLMVRLDSVEKENAFLKYEFHMLEKELEIRNEEVEFHRQSSDASHRKQMEGVKKISKLEAECQRLRVLVRKRLPGPAALVKIKNEVEMQGRNQTEVRRKLNPITGGLVVRDATRDNPLEIPSKKVSFLIQRLCDTEEENKILKEILGKKENELHSSRIICVRTASKLSQVEAQLRELSKDHQSMELVRCSPISNELPLTSGCDLGNDDETVGSGSWASALISELEHFRHGEAKNFPENKTRVSDMSLMDDFVEMEKLAMVSVENPSGSSFVTSETSRASSGYDLDITGMELVPVQVDSVDLEPENQMRDGTTGESSNWLQSVLKIILDQNRASKRNLDELLEDIRIALACVNHSSADAATKVKSSKHSGASDSLPISGYITWRSPNSSPRVNACNRVSNSDVSVERSCNEHVHSNLSTSICKIIELVKKIDSTSLKEGNSPDNLSDRDKSGLSNKNSVTPAEYSFHIFRWKSTDLSTVLQHFVETCNNLLNGKVSFEKFAGELTYALDWIINNCIVFQDISGLRCKIQKHFGWDGENKSEPGVEVKEQSSCLPLDACSHSQNVQVQVEKIQTELRAENKRFEDDLKKMASSQRDLEVKLQSANDKSEALKIQLQESERRIGSLNAELGTLKESKRSIEDQIENQILINEDLDTQLTVAKFKLNEVLQKLSSLEVEFEDKNHCCEELEATCLELQLQLESVANNEIPMDNVNQEEKMEEKMLQSGWEIKAASAKLAECQETIVSLGKQLKALSSSKETTVLEKVLSTTSSTTTNNKTLSQRSSLRDRMLAEDGVGAEYLESDNCDTFCAPGALLVPHEASFGSRHGTKTAGIGALAIVPSKKGGGGGFLRKLLLRRKRWSGKRTSSPLPRKQ